MPNIARVTLLIMLLHTALGAIIPYLPVWLAEAKGLTGTQTGLLLASSSFGRILFGPLAAAWAEGRLDRRTPLIAFGVMAALGYWTLGILAPFWPIALGCFATGVAVQCLVAFSESTTLRATANSVVWPYGRARALASTAFAAASLGAGACVQAFGVGAAYIWFVAALSVFCAASFALSPDPVETKPDRPMAARLWGGIGLFANKAFLLSVIAAGLIQAAHAFYYGFSSTLWLAQGFSGTQVGLLWALGVGIEVLFLAFVVPRLNHIRPETLILVGGLGSVLRWWSMSLGIGLAPTLMLQCLHALTFAATHIGLMRLIEARLHADQRATGQQVSSSLIMSPLMGVASIGAGALFDHFGRNGYMSGVTLAALGCLLILVVLMSPRGQTRSV
jgi:PPP family 3-phenylpropionic acid transporter